MHKMLNSKKEATMSQITECLIIIPAYNESKNMIKTLQMIRDAVPDMDCIVVNDASTDDTRDICRKHGIATLDLPINLGIGGAMQTGYQYAYAHGYSYAIQVDGDGQHDPRYIPAMLDTIKKTHADMVIGSRFIAKTGFQSSFVRRLGIRFFKGIIKLLTGKTITDVTSGLRLVSQDVIRLFAENYPTDYPEPETIIGLLASGYKIDEVPIEMMAREHGKSSISALKGVYYMIKVSLAIVITAFSRLYLDK